MSQWKPFTGCSQNHHCGTKSRNRHFYMKWIKFRCSWVTLSLHPAALFTWRLKLLTVNLKLWSVRHGPSGTLKHQHKLNCIYCITTHVARTVSKKYDCRLKVGISLPDGNWNHIHFFIFLQINLYLKLADVASVYLDTQIFTQASCAWCN